MKLEFNPQDPFPLLVSSDRISYEEEKHHAARVDAWLGFDTDAIEMKLALAAVSGAANPAREFWIGKSVQTFSTPYTELRSILEDVAPQPGDTIADLGAGYGRLAHVLARHYPRVAFKGYEFVGERQAEGRRVIGKWNLQGADLFQADVTTLDFSDETTSVYFMYDFGSRDDVEITVENLKKASSRRALTVVARGGRSRDVIQKNHAWLSQVIEPRHRVHYTIYRSS